MQRRNLTPFADEPSSAELESVAASFPVALDQRFDPDERKEGELALLKLYSLVKWCQYWSLFLKIYFVTNFMKWNSFMSIFLEILSYCALIGLL